MTNGCGSVNKAHNTQGIGEKKHGFPTCVWKADVE